MLTYLPFYDDRTAPFLGYVRLNGIVYYSYKDLLRVFKDQTDGLISIHEQYKADIKDLNIQLYSIGGKRESLVIYLLMLGRLLTVPVRSLAESKPVELDTVFLDLDGALHLSMLLSDPSVFAKHSRCMTEFAQRLAPPLGSAGGGKVTFSGKSGSSGGDGGFSWPSGGDGGFSASLGKREDPPAYAGGWGGFPASSSNGKGSSAVETIGFREVAYGACPNATDPSPLPVAFARPFDEERDAELPVVEATPFEGEPDPSMHAFQIVYRDESSVLVRVSSASPSVDGASAPPFPDPSVADSAQAVEEDGPGAGEPLRGGFDNAVSSLVDSVGGEGGAPASAQDDAVVPPAPREEPVVPPAPREEPVVPPAPREEEPEREEDCEGGVSIIPLDDIAQGTQAYCIVLGGEQYLSAKDVTASLLERLLGKASSTSYVTKKWDKVYEEARDRLGVLKPFRIPGRLFSETVLVDAL